MKKPIWCVIYSCAIGLPSVHDQNVELFGTKTDARYRFRDLVVEDLHSNGYYLDGRGWIHDQRDPDPNSPQPDAIKKFLFNSTKNEYIRQSHETSYAISCRPVFKTRRKS